MITVLVMVAVLIASMMVFGLGSQLQQSIRQVRYIQDDTQHLYFSEQVFAMLVNRLKQSGWNQRFYYKVEPPQSSEAGSGKLGGLGSVDEPTYEWFVQDVMDQVGGIRRDLTDVFVKVTYLGAVQSFMQRVRFRQPSNVRPTAALVQRFARIGREREFLDPLIRDELVAAADRDERLRLANRATHRVIGRVMRGMARRDMPVAAAVATLLGERMERPGPVASDGGGSVLSWLLRLTASPVHAGVSADEKALGDNLSEAHARGRKVRGAAGSERLPVDAVAEAGSPLQAEIVRERSVLDLWAGGEAALEAAPRNFAVARERFAAAVNAAGAQGLPHRNETLPRSLFLRAKTLTLQADGLGDGPWDPAEPTAEGMQALTCGDSSSAPAGADARTRARLAHLAEAALDYKRITEEFPGGRDAAHAWIPWGWLAVRAVLDPGIDPEDREASQTVRAGVWNQARHCAYERFEQLRAQEPYRQYHLWGEGAMTTRLPVNPDPAAHDPGLDELVYYERELVKPRLAAVLKLPGGTWSLILSNPDGTESVPVFSAADVSDMFRDTPTHLTWSAVGDAVLFLGSPLAGSREIFEYDLNSNRLRQITNSSELVEHFEPVKQGEHIVAAYGSGERQRLTLLNRTGERLEQLVSGISAYYIERHGDMLCYRRRVGEAWVWYQRELRDASSERVLPLNGEVTVMAVSPDRSHIAWVDVRSPISVVISKTQGERRGQERKFELDLVVPRFLEWSADQTKLRWWGIIPNRSKSMWALDLLTGEIEQPFGETVYHFASSPAQQ
ncbi:MAG: hypothetical protein HYY25_15820 [Candidatus Wallbacteria bacterium]|nr:hypothetical protein [Candidatus Wallbacteria bacterium]